MRRVAATGPEIWRSLKLVVRRMAEKRTEIKLKLVQKQETEQGPRFLREA